MADRLSVWHTVWEAKESALPIGDNIRVSRVLSSMVVWLADGTVSDAVDDMVGDVLSNVVGDQLDDVVSEAISNTAGIMASGAIYGA
ncbi:hypothetical protein ABZP36_016583 [Zizania latifolia]